MLFGAGSGRRSASQLIAFVCDGVVKTPGLFTGGGLRSVDLTGRRGSLAALSAGVDHRTFVGPVETALVSGASGVTAGRPPWKDCVSLDRTKRRRLPATRAVARLGEIQETIARHRRPPTCLRSAD